MLLFPSTQGVFLVLESKTAHCNDRDRVDNCHQPNVHLAQRLQPLWAPCLHKNKQTHSFMLSSHVSISSNKCAFSRTCHVICGLWYLIEIPLLLNLKFSPLQRSLGRRTSGWMIPSMMSPTSTPEPEPPVYTVEDPTEVFSKHWTRSHANGLLIISNMVTEKHSKLRPDAFKLLMERGDGANKTFRRELLFVFVCLHTLCRKRVQIKSYSFH